jgi:hypothetical protein
MASLKSSVKELDGLDDSSNVLAPAFAPVDKIALGVACGVVCALGVFLVTVLEIIAHRGRPIQSSLALWGQFFWGYSVSWKGAVIGLFWAGITGFLTGWILALVRNFSLACYLLVIKSEAEAEAYRDFLEHL